MNTEPTPTRTLAEHILGYDLTTYVLAKRDARPQWPWRLIAEELAIDTDGKVNVSGETLRQWYGGAT